MKWGLRRAVGLTNEGTQCPNQVTDQQQVGELLDAAQLPAGGTPLESMPPIGEGFASSELCEAIRGFREVQGLVAYARGDVDRATWRRLTELVDPGHAPPGGTPVLRAELSLNGPLKASWADSFPLACEVAPDVKALEQAARHRCGAHPSF